MDLLLSSWLQGVSGVHRRPPQGAQQPLFSCCRSIRSASASQLVWKSLGSGAGSGLFCCQGHSKVSAFWTWACLLYINISCLHSWDRFQESCVLSPPPFLFSRISIRKNQHWYWAAKPLLHPHTDNGNNSKYVLILRFDTRVKWVSNNVAQPMVLFRHFDSCRHESASDGGSGRGPGAPNVWELSVGRRLVETKVQHISSIFKDDAFICFVA